MGFESPRPFWFAGFCIFSIFDFSGDSDMIYNMLDQNEEDLLRRTYEIEKENNTMLKTLYRSMLWGRLFRFAYWVIIISAMLGAYYYVQPYIDPVLKAYNNVSGFVGGATLPAKR
jgi:hypothetical protein